MRLALHSLQSFGVITIQLARKWGAKVFTTACNEEEAQMLRTMSLDVERTLSGHQFMRNSILDETGGLGVDCVVDNGGWWFLCLKSLANAAFYTSNKT